MTLGFKLSKHKTLISKHNIYVMSEYKNKRAQRALGRSPEENVKGQGEAIYRGPLMLSTKYW